MDSKNKLIEAIQNELDNADFSNEQSCDDSYQLFLTKTNEIYKSTSDDSLDIHDIVEVVNILDNLELSLKEAYIEAIKYLIGV